MCGSKMQPGNRIYFFKMWKNVREWTHTPPSGLPLWELESLWSFEFSQSDLKDQNSLDWTFHYTIGIFLIHTCLKWAYIIHLNTYNTNYGKKRRHESKCKFDFWPLKVENYPDLRVRRWHATYCWKTLGYNCFLSLTSIEGLHKKLWASKVDGVPILRISRLLTWRSREKWHLGATPVANHKEYYNGEGGGFPLSLVHGESYEFAYAHDLSMHQKCFNYALTNLCLVYASLYE
jgi:hypothetical protein